MIVVSTAGGTQEAVSDALLEIIPADEISNALDEAPFREGPPPETPGGIPHQQYNQNAPVAMQKALRAAAAALPGIRFEPTPFSLSGSVGWRLEKRFARGPAGAFIRQSLEFGHQHVPADGSMHMLLPLEFAAAALEKGWGVIHPLTDSISGEQSEYVIHPLTDSISGEQSEYVMIFGPRDEGELRTVWIIAQISYYQARGLSMEPES
jgi:hypothetical protein